MGDVFSIALLQNTLRTATPIVLAAMGGLFSDHAGIMNIGMDGMMLIGAFFAVAGSIFFANAWLGLLIAVLVGLLLGLIYGLFVVKFKSDEFIIGVALNVFAGGFTVFMLRELFGVKSSVSAGVVPLPVINIPWLNNVPILGELFNGMSVLVFVSWILVIVCYIIVFKTPFGYRLRAAGAKPETLMHSGIDPRPIKYAASLICGMFCGLAGAHLSLGYLSQFSRDMTASRGYIAFACIMFGGSQPIKVFLAALFFGFLDALSLRVQDVIPSQLTAMTPYVATVLALVLMALRRQAKKRRQEKLQLALH